MLDMTERDTQANHPIILRTSFVMNFLNILKIGYSDYRTCRENIIIVIVRGGASNICII